MVNKHVQQTFSDAVFCCHLKDAHVGIENIIVLWRLVLAHMCLALAHLGSAWSRWAFAMFGCLSCGSLS